MIWVTGDCHGNFQRFKTEHFPEQKNISREDCVIICGDYAAKNIMPKLFILR